VTPRSTYRARVGYIDTDQGGVAHHTTYFRWLEQARIELLREGGLEYRSWEEATRLGLPVVEARVHYLRPARFDDVVHIETWVGAGARAAIRFDSVVTLEGHDEIIHEAQIRLACVHLDGGARRMPDEVLRACLGPQFESRLVSVGKTKPGR
jgi:acyl-CoA thioester hydrolase